MHVAQPKDTALNESTLIVGVDVAKNRHVARCKSLRNQPLGKAFPFHNTSHDFHRLLAFVRQVQSEHGFSDVVVGMEPTGTYWMGLCAWLRKQGIRVVLVNPMHVNRTKECDDNSPTKTDSKDAGVIGRLVANSSFTEAHLPSGIYADLRSLVLVREQLRDAHPQALCRLRSWLNRFFPEFESVFADVTALAAQAALRAFPLPFDVGNHSVDEVGAVFRKATKGRVWMKHAHLLSHAAQHSIGLTEGLAAARLHLTLLLDQLEFYARQLAQIEAQLVESFMQVPGAAHILTIPGLGPVQAAIIVAELGDLRRYRHPKQLQKMAGLGLRESSSGQHTGRRTICKRGRRRLRSVLYLAVLGMVTHNPHFALLHQRFKARPGRPLTGKQSLIALCVKLLTLIFALAKNQQPYNPARLHPPAVA